MPSVNGPKLVKLHNLQLARRQLFLQRAATRLELSQTTGISTVTLGTLLRELVQLGQVTEEEAPPPASGRPSRVYRFNADLSHGLLVSVENHRLNTMCECLGIELDHHHAGSDSHACGEILRRYLDEGVEIDRFIRTYDLKTGRTVR